MNSTVMLALIIIALVILFLAVVSWINAYKKKEREKKLWKEFNDFVITNKLTIDKKQTLNKNVIGLDRLNMMLIFIDNTSNPVKTHLIPLLDLAACNLKKERNSKGNLSRIYLDCYYKRTSNTELQLPFYDENFDTHSKVIRLSKKASYWEKTINIFREMAPMTLKTQS